MLERSARQLWSRAQLAVAAIDAEAATTSAQGSFDRGPWAAFITCALSLTLMEYLAGPRHLVWLLRSVHELAPTLVPEISELRTGRWYALMDLGFWVLTRALGFLVLPALVIKLVLRRRVREFGLSMRGVRGHLSIYALLFALLLPLLIFAALRPEFTAYYPFYRHAGDSWFDLGCWELLYAFQFFCVEFFFRGFLLEATRSKLGNTAALAAMVPYCMVHFSKPLLEVLGAIPAGIGLGLLAMSLRSIWGGVLLHVAVAWSMDVLALAQAGGLPRGWWP